MKHLKNEYETAWLFDFDLQCLRIFYNHMSSHKSENTSRESLLSLKKVLRHDVRKGRKHSIFMFAGGIFEGEL